MRYNDTTSAMQVIGNLYVNPSLLDMKDKYFFNKEDFVEEFHQILFVAINNLHELGAKMLTPAVIEDYSGCYFWILLSKIKENDIIKNV